MGSPAPLVPSATQRSAARLAARVAALPAEEMRRSVVRDTLLVEGPARAAEILHLLLEPDRPRSERVAIVAASCVACFAGGSGLPYAFVAELYAVAETRGFDEV